MNNKFDELTKGLAQSVTRRAALKKLGVGLAGMALACFGLANKAEAGNCLGSRQPCSKNNECCTGYCRPDHTCGCRSPKNCGKRGEGPECWSDGNDGYSGNDGYCAWPFP